MVLDEILWFFGQAASLFVWLYPIIYIFNMQHKDALRTQSWAKQNKNIFDTDKSFKSKFNMSESLDSDS